MIKKEIKKLNKIIEKYYHLYGRMYQQLYINCMEVLDTDSCNLDIYLWDAKKKEYGIYLFTIQNYNGFKDLEIVFDSYFKERKVIETWDGVKASYAPLYMDRIYTLPKFTGITKEDIINCATHFGRKILDNWMIWNIHFAEQEDNNQLTWGF